MNIGKQIRTNRLRLNMTQEQLAEKLHLSPQAVSKWENAATLPDIALLPELSALFGVTIDELFDSPDEMHLNRIEVMLEREQMLPRTDFDYAVARLKEGTENASARGRCLTLLGELYQQRSQGYAALAAATAKQALALEPEKKANHCLLFQAQHGGMGDWCCANHTTLIDYYKRFTADHPTYLPGYMWLLDNLIADNRLAEADEVLNQMKSVKETYHAPFYAGWIAWHAGHHDAAERLWQSMTDLYCDEWLAWCSRADTYAARAMYPQAIALFHEAARRQVAPRYTDVWDSIAQLSLLIGDRAKAAEAWREVLRILREEWSITEGETVRGYEENIQGALNP